MGSRKLAVARLDRIMPARRAKLQFRVALDNSQGLVGEHADQQLIDRGLAKLGFEGELLTRHPLARQIIPDRCRDTFAIRQLRPPISAEVVPSGNMQVRFRKIQAYSG
jgi:hypothetical protein